MSSEQPESSDQASGGEGALAGIGALVTGGGSGIGLAIASRLAADGAAVTICGRTEAKLEAAAAQIAQASGRNIEVGHTVADVTDEAQVESAVEATQERAGNLGIVVANAGGSAHMGPFTTADSGAVRDTIDLNLMGTVLTIKASAMAMEESGGSIVAISSGAGGFPHRNLWAYGAAKAGIDRLCQYAAEELGDKGIRVNSVQPGIVDNELMAFITAGGALWEDYLANMPLGRAGTVEDVAEAVRFLAGPESSWITGVNLAIDGGHHLRRGADYSLLFQ